MAYARVICIIYIRESMHTTSTTRVLSSMYTMDIMHITKYVYYFIWIFYVDTLL